MQKLNFPLLEVQPVTEYFRQFEKYEIIREEVEKDNGEIDILVKDELIRIVYLMINGGKFWSVYTVSYTHLYI